MHYSSHRLIAHRGASSIAPENTLAAFKAAKARGASWIECDVQLSADQQLVVIHDFSLARTTNGRGLVRDHTLVQLQQLDAGSWFAPSFCDEKIPTLTETLRLCEQHQLNLCLELKLEAPDASRIAEQLLEVLNRESFSAELIVSSFCHQSLQAVRALDSKVALALLLEINDWQRDWCDQRGHYQQLMQQLDVVSLNVNQEILNAERVQQLKAMAPQLMAYTVNDSTRQKQLLSYGVDAIFSDFPVVRD